MRIITRPAEKPRKRNRDPQVVGRYHQVRAGLMCEYCHLRPGGELNHVLHGQQKEDAPWNFHVVCADCHRHSVHGFHGSRPRWDVERALRAKISQGFCLPREAYAFLGGVDGWPGTVQSMEEQFVLSERIAFDERSCS